MKRVFDLSMALALGVLSLGPGLILAMLVKLTSAGSVLYWSDRMGKGNRPFRMPKFRTMRLGTPAVATDLLGNPAAYMTPVGSLMRRSSLDEIPQLWSVLKGDMSLVGPRPALVNQTELIALRTESGVHELLPGVTGWAQINGRDQLSDAGKAALDREYLLRRSFWFDLRVLWLTLFRVVSREGIAH